ncbi:hypothetical protein KB681_gp50 [Burkholderia phage Mica]|uniref:DUF4031 domain-containing protein n=1 Tax=Burkholderia phage Mica TaxID=2767579 RepID=A0A873WI68_9CAUD|nr:hypothetical protein KB681_gp50 [Burkholderia phage Mica]QPB08662.1 hypothetical protein CPT_Mica_050 [Burkholderia phage Mica]
MAVYVDDMRARKGRMVFCHMIADTDEELHAMAARIGVARKWHQAPPRHDSHYDICLSMRAKAVKFGAIEITWKECGAMNAMRRYTGSLGEPHDAVDRLLAHNAARRAAA